MDNTGKTDTWSSVSPYMTGYNYGRSLLGYVQRYGLQPLTPLEATAHAERMASPYTGNDASDFVRGFILGYGLENKEAQAHNG